LILFCLLLIYFLVHLFELTGFEVIAEYSDFFRAPPAYGKDQLWIVRKV